MQIIHAKLAVEVQMYILINKRLLLRCLHHFKSDLINDMDHMRISGTEPSSVILSQILLLTGLCV